MLKQIIILLLRFKHNFDWVLMTFFLHLITHFFGRYFPFFLSIIFFWTVLLLIGLSKLNKKSKTIMRIILIIIVLSLFAPIDICFRSSSRLQVVILPVVLSNGCNNTIRQYKKCGFIENRDFIIYRWKTTTYPALSIVFFIPCSAGS